MSDTNQDNKISQKIPKGQNGVEREPAVVDGEIQRGFLEDMADNIEDGAKMVEEKATELAEKLKKGLSQAYEAGAKVIDELSHTAQEYADKYRAESEIKKLKNEKDMLLTQLGLSFFKHRLTGNKFAESFFKKDLVSDQFHQIELLDEKMIEIGKQLDDGNE